MKRAYKVPSRSALGIRFGGALLERGVKLTLPPSGFSGDLFLGVLPMLAVR